ncbi:MAG: type IX secretion system membrane protein PorP/SprF, partial [Bacteroidetes bacterium]
MKRIITILIVSLSIGANAQQDLLVSQYMFNHLLLNPSYS